MQNPTVDTNIIPPEKGMDLMADWNDVFNNSQQCGDVSLPSAFYSNIFWNF